MRRRTTGCGRLPFANLGFPHTSHRFLLELDENVRFRLDRSTPFVDPRKWLGYGLLAVFTQFSISMLGG
jgi:hypothetical protein